MGDEQKPKLLVLGGPHVDPTALEESLGQVFELIESSPDDAINTLEEQGCQAVLAEAGDFVPLERDLVSRQASVLLNAIGEGVCLSDMKGGVIWANAMYSAFSDRVRRRVLEVCAQDGERFVSALKSRDQHKGGIAGLRARKHRISFTKKSRHYEVMVSPVMAAVGESGSARSDRGAGLLVVAVVRDVSSSVRLEQKLESINRAGKELAHLEADTIKKLHASERLRLLQDRVIKYAHELLHFDHFAVRMLNPRTTALDLVMAYGIPEDAKDIALYALKDGNGMSGYVAATGEAYICNNTTADPRYVFGLDEPGSSLTVPLRVFDKVVGIFNVESSETDAFSETDRRFAELFSGHLASALHTLNLLLVERYTTSEATTGTMHGEISGPLNDLVAEVELLKEQSGENAELSPHLDRILRDVSSIRRRIRNVSRGPQTMLGAEQIVEAGKILPELEHRRVLVADNEETVLNIVRDVLTAVGCQVVTCDDGVSAIRLLETWQHTFDADEGFDLVLSDINLGDKTGYDVFGAARRARSELPVILMTGFGYDPHHSIVRATQEGLHAVLFKPFQAEKLIDEACKAVTKSKG